MNRQPLKMQCVLACSKVSCAYNIVRSLCMQYWMFMISSCHDNRDGEIAL